MFGACRLVCPDCCSKDLPVQEDRVKLFSTRERQSDCMVAISRRTVSDTRPMVNMSDLKAFIRAHVSIPGL